MWVAGEVTEGHPEPSKQHCSLLEPTPPTHIQRHNAATWVAHPGEHLRLRPLRSKGRNETKNMAQMKEQIKVPKIELSNEEIANLSDAECKTLVIRMFTEMVQYGCKIEKEVKTMHSEIKENIQGTNSDVKETRTQINSLAQKEEVNI